MMTSLTSSGLSTRTVWVCGFFRCCWWLGFRFAAVGQMSINVSRVGDTEVQGTNDDAQVSKLSCVNLGYFEDDYLKHFVKRPSRRSPLINRGYYARHASLKALLRQFLVLFPNKAPCQILSLGAGFDTTWFNLSPEVQAQTRYFELDFPEVTIQKASVIASTTVLRDMVESAAKSGKIGGELNKGEIVAGGYNLLPVDLRNSTVAQDKLNKAGFDSSLPTYVLSECVLVYLNPEESRAVVRWLGNLLKNAVFVVYEQIKPDDAFGQQMIRNLQARGCGLRGLHSTPTLEAHKRRFTSSNWERALAWDMDTIFRKFINPEEHRRISRIEIFDEFEEWHMIQEHYSISIGINDAKGLFKNFTFKEQAQ